MAEEKEVFQVEYPCHSHNAQRWFLLRGTQFKGAYGLRIVLSHQNITHRKMVELDLQQALSDLRKSEQQIVEHERQRALTTMASGIAHDFNNALSPIQGFSSMLLESPDLLEDRDKAVRYITNIYKAASNAAQTVRRLRKFYRPRENDVFKNVDLNSVVNDAVSMTAPRWQQEAAAVSKNIDVKTHLDEIPDISGNEGELNEVLTNLIFNAVDAITDTADGAIEISTYSDNDSVVLKFSDNGKGMSETTKQWCFDPFYSTKGPDGSGLGLATIQGIIQRHNGDIEVESKEGEGTTFRMTFPKAEQVDSETEGIEQQQLSHLKILIVEDDKSQQEMLEEMLKTAGHTTDVASDGIEALKRFNADWYDAIITDRAMPSMGGDELATKIKATVPEKPVIMLTGFGDMMEATHEQPQTVDHLICKPVTTTKLRDALSKVL